jgi:alpha-N-arabinofuranosidase
MDSRMPILLQRLAFLCLFAASAPLAQAATTSGTVQADQPGPVIAPEVHGQFMEQLGTGIDGGIWVGTGSPIANTRGYRNDVLQALKALEVPLLRWPGGCYADIYHWRDGIGPRPARPVTLNRWWGNKEERNGFGTHEFFEFAEMIGAKTYLNINLGTGSPREAAQWVEYITSPSASTRAQERRRNGREAPWKIDYLGIGNEPNGCGGRMRPAAFADLFRQYVGFLAPHGGTTFVAAGPDATSEEWTRTVMDVAGKHLDAYSLHYYTLPTGDWKTKGPATGFDEAQWRATFEQAYRIEALIGEHAAIMDGFDPKAEKILAVDEWGAWYDPTPGSSEGWLQQQNSLRDGLLAAVHLNIFHRNARRVRLANIAQMVNVLQAMILTDGPKMVLTPTYHAFSLYRPFQGATSLPLTLQSPAYGRVQAVDGSAALGTDGRLHVALVNLDPGEANEVSLLLQGWSGARVSGQVLTAAALDTHNTFDQPDALRPIAFDGARVEKGRLSLTLPPKSLVVLALE